MMSYSLPVISLCTFSKANEGVCFDMDDGHPFPSCTADKLDECPLDLAASHATYCPCRRNVRLGSNFEGASIRGASCSYPLTNTGDEVRNAGALAAWVKRQANRHS